MAENTLHYAGDTFDLDDEDAAHVMEAIRLAGEGNGIVATLVDIEGHAATGGPSITHTFLFGPGIPVYLTTTAELG